LCHFAGSDTGDLVKDVAEQCRTRVRLDRQTCKASSSRANARRASGNSSGGCHDVGSDDTKHETRRLVEGNRQKVGSSRQRCRARLLLPCVYCCCASCLVTALFTVVDPREYKCESKTGSW
jgi:hypothetical protein